MLNSMSQDYFEAVRDRDEARRLAEYYREKYAYASDQGNDDLPRFPWEPDEDE
jgi:hypothetical protein